MYVIGVTPRQKSTAVSQIHQTRSQVENEMNIQQNRVRTSRDFKISQE